MPITLFIDNTATDSVKVNNTGNQITTILNPPIHLDNKKKYVLRVISPQILYCFSNVFTDVNDKVYYTKDNQPYRIVFPQGIYTLNSINEEISRQTNDNNSNPYLFSVQGDAANSSVYIEFNDSLLTIDCNHSDSLLINLGFPMSTGVIGPYFEAGTQYSLGNHADLNTTSSLYINCDICSGSYTKGSTSSVVASILINSLPFTTIDFEPLNPVRIDISRYDINSITFTLLNQDLKPVDMNSNNGTQKYEPWSCVIEIDEFDTKTGRLI